MEPRRRLPLLSLLVAMVTSLVACGGPARPIQTDDVARSGTIAGTIAVRESSAALGHPLHGASRMRPTEAPASGGAEFVPGDVIVRFASGTRPHAFAPVSVADVRFEVVGAIPGRDTALLRNVHLGRADTLALARRLDARPDVLFAHPNHLVETLQEPNDTLYGRQWHYGAIGMPAAWDITTGDAGVVVAVVDTGILHSATDPSRTHPDLVGKVLPGYDFVSSSLSSGDGDGRDADPYDEGNGSHGTHVAGTIAAATGNDIGVAGVDWNAMLLPVRVLGSDGSGTSFDVVEGTLWAAGFAITGVPTNQNPAHVINLSLGGSGSCTSLFQDAFDRIVSDSPRAAVVVVAAGNEGIDVVHSSPANCRNVITVGATEYRGHRTGYSNYGTRIDVMAPGGDTSVDRNQDGFADGVYSLVRNPNTGAFGYGYLQGTSMAAPHVAGVVSLMKALDPGITHQEAVSALAATAEPLTPSACGRPSAAECGAGLIDAAAALTLVRDGTVPVSGAGALSFEPFGLDFGVSDEGSSVTLRNVGAETLSWEFAQVVASPDNPGPMPDGSVTLSTSSGSIEGGGTQALDVWIDRSRFGADGAYAFAIQFEVGGDAALLSAAFVMGDASVPTLSGPLTVTAFLDSGQDDPVVSGFAVLDAISPNFDLEVLAGDNRVIAWSDENDNQVVDAGDFLGVYPSLVQVVPGGSVSGLMVEIERVSTFGRTSGTEAVVRPPWQRLLEEEARARR